VANSENRNLISVVSIKRHVAAIPELDKPFPEFLRHFLDGPADLWMPTKHLQSEPKRAHRSLCSVKVLVSQKPV
jgi:hypothetical protein